MRKYTYDEVAKVFNDYNCILVDKEYRSASQKLNYICECGELSKITFSNIKRGQKCRKCGITKRKGPTRKHTFAEVKSFFSENNCTLLEEEYINCETHMRYICECGRESKITFDKFRRGKRCQGCKVDKLSGENNVNWNFSKTEEERILQRKYPEYTRWRNEVYQRDNYTCQSCFKRSSITINAHHLDGYHWAKEKRTDVNNGVTLCEDCHADFHSIYGKGRNTREQYDEWIQNKRKQDAI